MKNGRSVTLQVGYTPSGDTASVTAEGVQAITLVPGRAIKLNNAPIYVSSVAGKPAGYKSGIFYIYDGICMRGRYRITNLASRCGKTPMATYVTGWLPAEYCADASTESSEPLGVTAKIDVTEYIESITYVDNASDNSDSVDITLTATDARWIGEWLPQKGAALYPKIFGHNWEKDGDERELSCGSFTLDDIDFSDTPSVLKLGGVSKPANSDFSDRKREAVWKNTSIKRIGETIAARYGLGFSYDGEDYSVECDEQDGEDSSYYHSLCKSYGLILKVYAGRLWVYDREAYKRKPSVCTIDRTQIERGSFSWNTTLYGTYTGGSFSYTDSDTDRDISCSVGGGAKQKTVSRRSSSVQDAAVQLCAELNNANHGNTSVKFSLSGVWNVSAGSNIELTGYGKLNGKYFADKITHKVTRSGGFTSTLECSLAEEGFSPTMIGGSGTTSTVQTAQTTQGATQASTNTSASTRKEPKNRAGKAVLLNNALLYGGTKTSYTHGRRTGIYYLYDGILVNGRYSLARTAARCGKLPSGENVIGWVKKTDCKFVQTTAVGGTPVGGTLSEVFYTGFTG